jgi:hypothetical protein
MPERVSRVVLTERCAPDQQTFSESVGMSQGCQAATLRALRALRRTLRSAASQRERSQVREVSGVPCVLQQFVFQIEFGVRCPPVVRPGHDDIFNSRVEKRPKQCDGPHKSCHRCRQSTCTGTVGLASSRHRLVRTFVYSVGLRSAFIVCLGARVANPIPGSVMLFGWFRSKGARDRSRLIKRIVSILKRGRDVF